MTYGDSNRMHWVHFHWTIIGQQQQYIRTHIGKLLSTQFALLIDIVDTVYYHLSKEDVTKKHRWNTSLIVGCFLP